MIGIILIIIEVWKPWFPNIYNNLIENFVFKFELSINLNKFNCVLVLKKNS